MTTLRVKKLRPDAIVPRYVREGDAGLDLHTCERATIAPKERVILPTGIAIAIPEGMVGLIWDRSGLAARQGLTTISGVLDCTYRGEIHVILFNTSDEPYTIEKGDRVAQLLVQPIVTAHIEEVDALEDTVRGENKFGSSGR